jgi:hypothetical protein
MTEVMPGYESVGRSAIFLSIYAVRGRTENSAVGRTVIYLVFILRTIPLFLSYLEPTELWQPNCMYCVGRQPTWCKKLKKGD